MEKVFDSEQGIESKGSGRNGWIKDRRISFGGAYRTAFLDDLWFLT